MDSVDPLPHAMLAEKSVLSVMFRDPANIAKAAAEGITADAFHIPAHREILLHLIRCRDAGDLAPGGEIELTTFVQSAHMAGLLQRMGGPSQVYDIFGYSSGITRLIGSWCDQLRECKARRIAIAAAKTIGESADSEEAMTAAKDALEAMRKAVTAKTRSLNAKQACEDFITSYVASYSNGDIPGVSTGIDEIDAITGGAKEGELWVVSGPPSSGKSVLMYQLASEFLGNNKVVSIFTAELMVREVVGRLVTLSARVPYQAITTPREITKFEMSKIRDAINQMEKTRMWIDAAGGQSIETISGEAERIRDIEGKIDMVVADYIQIFKGIRSKGDSREMEVASISGGLKQLAKKLGCPVITGSQENDDGQTRESRAIEQDADVWIKITSDGLLLKKVRNGKRDQTLPLALDGAVQRFRRFAK